MRSLGAAIFALGCVLTGCDGEPDLSTGPGDASSSVSPATPTSTARPSADAWVDGLPIGAPPAVGYAIGHTYHSPDGRMIRLPRDWGVTSITRLGKGFLVTNDRSFEGSTGLYRLDGDGRIDTSAGERGHVPGATTVSSYPVLSADGATVHWLTFTPPETGLDLPTLLHAGNVATGEVAAVEVDLPPSFLTEVTGVIDGRAIVRSGWGGRGEAWISNGESGLSRIPALDRASLISSLSRLVAVDVGADAMGVLDFDTRRLLWHRPHSYPMAFSPSGRQLLVVGRGRISVVDARTGVVRHGLAPPPYRRARWFSYQLAWEDERHLLAGVKLARRAAVVRIDIESGDTELAVDWTPTEGALYVTFETTR